VPSRSSPRISLRKKPSQDRSSRLVADILEGAVRVLAEAGAHRFTTARVAERAGVSVGSLYQYFPNKEAILFRLQTEEWVRTSNQLAEILSDRKYSPAQRVRKAMRYFFQTECEEAAFRQALEDAAPLYRDAPEAKQLQTKSRRLILTFLREALPSISARKRALAADVLLMTVGAAGEQISAESKSLRQVEALADSMADMFCAYLDHLAQPRLPSSISPRNKLNHPSSAPR
jgi:AcrR family transcriptional regulator